MMWGLMGSLQVIVVMSVNSGLRPPAFLSLSLLPDYPMANRFPLPRVSVMMSCLLEGPEATEPSDRELNLWLK